MADLLKSNWVLLSPDKNSLYFGDIVSKIDNCCKAYSNDREPFQNKFEIEDIEFRTYFEKIYFQMKNFLKNHWNGTYSKFWIMYSCYFL